MMERLTGLSAAGAGMKITNTNLSNHDTNIKTTAPGLQEDEAETELGNGNIQDEMTC